MAGSPNDAKKCLSGLGCLAVIFGICTATSAADNKGPSYPQPAAARDVKMMPEAWKTAPTKKASPQEIDQLLNAALKNDKISAAPLTTDEQFIRRVTLDLTGRLPLPADVEEFTTSKDPQKRSKLIDRLLDSDEFCRHWAAYWHNVVVARATDERLKRIGTTRALEQWMYQQLKNNRSWRQIAHDLLTAKGELRNEARETGENGAAVFLLLHQGADAPVERAAEASRVFLGIQVQCAQCHDHPHDIWKRTQFHELTAYFARMREQPIRVAGGRIEGVQIISTRIGEHRMPDLENPGRATTMSPKFLTGEKTRDGLDDAARRGALSDYITSKDNYWFSAAFVNRAWGEMMGQAFYQPVDNMGPLQQATYPDVLLRLAASFRSTDYDVKELFRLVANTQAYQRQMRLGDNPDDHLHFSAAYPRRLPAGALWDSLQAALGTLPQGRPGAGGPGGFGGRPGGFFTFERVFKDTFDFDPSTKADEVEGSIPQALMLMNNGAINSQIRASGNTVLARILSSNADDTEAIKMVYLRTLARKPTANELATAEKFVKKVGNRNEAFEDLMWTLVNSTEFQTKR